jgi:uncharacterized membrane protein SpoIIM required for sporulation
LQHFTTLHLPPLLLFQLKEKFLFSSSSIILNYMREGEFINRNKARWDACQTPTNDPDELAKRFAQLVDDLSYARTHYPYSKIVKYINALAAGIYLSIYKNKKEKKNRLAHFFRIELPLILYRQRGKLRTALLFFLAFMALGIFSSWQEPGFVRGVLGDEYVNMTEANIARGDPFNVYKDQNELIMFLRIAWNNIKVSLFCFASGLFFSIGTIWILFQNGLMLGTFEQMFFAHNLGVKSILVVFIHGTLEISAIVISGGAGLVMGHSILFPKTYSRLTSLRMGAKDGIKITISLIPIFIVAAFFEGYVTRHTEMPVWLSTSILLSSLAFIIWYFIWYPARIARSVVPAAGHQSTPGLKVDGV